MKKWQLGFVFMGCLTMSAAFSSGAQINCPDQIKTTCTKYCTSVSSTYKGQQCSMSDCKCNGPAAEFGGCGGSQTCNATFTCSCDNGEQKAFSQSVTFGH